MDAAAQTRFGLQPASTPSTNPPVIWPTYEYKQYKYIAANPPLCNRVGPGSFEYARCDRKWAVWRNASTVILNARALSNATVKDAFRDCDAIPDYSPSNPTRHAADITTCRAAQDKVLDAIEFDSLAAQYAGYEAQFSFDLPVRVNGVMMAKDFKFDRTYLGGGADGSETIRNTGRHIVNPPPGLTDLTRNLPSLQ